MFTAGRKFEDDHKFSFSCDSMHALLKILIKMFEHMTDHLFADDCQALLEVDFVN